MYGPPGFTVITCEPVTEEAFRAWAVGNGGVWHPAESKPYRRAHMAWEFPSGYDIAAYLGTPMEKESAEWTPRMHIPPQSVIDIEVEEYANSDAEQWTLLIRALFAQWDSYAYDPGLPEWISTLLRDILPTERIIHYEPLPLSAGPAWIWNKGKYMKNEAYYDNRNADEARDENQL